MRKLVVVLAAMLAMLTATSAAQGTLAESSGVASPTTLTVGKQSASCPSPGYLRIRDAIRDAQDGDTIAICPGTYAEGPGTPGTSVLTINKNLTLRGAGADQVTIEPRHVDENRIAADDPDLRDGRGVIIAVIGNKTDPTTVDISGVTVDANGVDATAGILYIDGQGSITRSHVTGLAVDEGKNGYQVPGGFRNNNYGVGIAMVTRVTPPKNKPKTQPDPHPDDRLHADRPLQRGRRARRRLDGLLPADADGAARRVRDRQPRSDRQLADHRPQLVPGL